MVHGLLTRLMVLLMSFGIADVFSVSPHQFLVISDIHFGSKNSSEVGQDTGPDLFAVSLAKLKALSQHVDFILVLGDLPTHRLLNAPAIKANDEKEVFRGLYQANRNAKPMFYVPGNNDSLAGNYQAFQWQGQSPLSQATDWTGACAHCEGLVLDGTAMQRHGYYSSYVVPKNKEIILIALNTILWTTPPFFLLSDSNRAKGAEEQFFWLDKQLRTHHAKQLLIAMHIPPGLNDKGKSFWHDAYLKRFRHLLEQYHHQYGEITLLTSHTHRDELRKIQLKNGKNIYAYSTPSISRIYYNNSALKVFKLNNRLGFENFTTYYTTTNKAWGNEQYQALHGSKAMIPNCRRDSLPECLNSLTDEQVCEALHQGMYYGVKSRLVAGVDNTCHLLYRVKA